MRYEVGVTLLETMVTVSIAAILLATGIPGMIDFVQDTRRGVVMYDIVSYLNFTRSEAIKRRQRITLCPSKDGLACTGKTAWESGWMSFVDADSDGVVDPGEEILRVHGPLHIPTTLQGGRKRITYQSQGFSTGYNDTLEYCDGRGNEKGSRAVVSMQGRVRVVALGSNCP